MQWCAKKQRWRSRSAWGRNIEVVESVVYASFLLVDAAKEVGIEVKKVRECPYFRSSPKTKLCRQASLLRTVWHWSC